MTPTRCFFGASHEHFPPEALLEQAVAAERAGFDGISASDHLQPWWEPGESGHIERLRELEQLGATVIVLQNNPGADPLRAIEVYGEQVLPELRGARV
jgi:hypothetical protein